MTLLRMVLLVGGVNLIAAGFHMEPELLAQIICGFLGGVCLGGFCLTFGGRP